MVLRGSRASSRASRARHVLCHHNCFSMILIYSCLDYSKTISLVDKTVIIQYVTRSEGQIC